MTKKTFIGVFCPVIWVATITTGFAQTKIVSPSVSAEQEGNTSVHAIAGPVHVQQLYPATDFEDVPEGGAWLVGFADRADRRQRRTVNIDYDALTVTFSTTLKDNLSLTYADNEGSDAVKVINGPRQATYEVSENRPNPFTAIWEFDEPFFYDPQNGNLLLEFTTTSGAGTSFHLDSQHVSNIAEIGGSPGSARADFSTRTSIVEQFIFASEDELCLPLVHGSFVQRGDLDLDGQVSFADFLKLSSSFGKEGSYGDGDVDCDGTVGFTDFLHLSQNFSVGATGAVAAVPEPAGISIALLSILGLISLRTRR